MISNDPNILLTKNKMDIINDLNEIDIFAIENKIEEPLYFHPTTTPRGLNFYNGFILTSDQQSELNKLKLKTIRENHEYLSQHPEV